MLSTKNVVNVEPQVLIQQFLQQNMLVVGCNSLLATSTGGLNAVPAQTTKCEPAYTGACATVKDETDVHSNNITHKLSEVNAGCGADEVCVWTGISSF